MAAWNAVFSSDQPFFGCESRGISREVIALGGLPPRPVVGRTYSLTVALPDHGVNAVPYLGAE
jgi:hypothetical protein